MQSALLDDVRLFLSQRGVDGYLVGGYVRDRLLGKANEDIHDIDIAVGGDAVTLARSLADAVHGHFVLLDP